MGYLLKNIVLHWNIILYTLHVFEISFSWHHLFCWSFSGFGFSPPANQLKWDICRFVNAISFYSNSNETNEETTLIWAICLIFQPGFTISGLQISDPTLPFDAKRAYNAALCERHVPDVTDPLSSGSIGYALNSNCCCTAACRGMIKKGFHVSNLGRHHCNFMLMAYSWIDLKY